MDFLNDISIGRLLLILSPLIIINLILVVAAILSIARKALPWGQKWLWLVLVLAVDLIGPIVYFAVGSNLLEEKAANNQDSQERPQ